MRLSNFSKRKKILAVASLCMISLLFSPIIASFATTYTQDILDTISGTPVVNPNQQNILGNMISSIIVHIDPYFLESVTGQPKVNPNQQQPVETMSACATVNITTGTNAYSSCTTGYKIHNPQNIKVKEKTGGSETTTTASSFQADAGSNYTVEGIINCTYTANYEAYINQENSNGFQVISNISLAGTAVPYYSSADNGLAWGNSTSGADHAKVCIPPGYRVTSSSSPTSQSGQQYDLNGTGIQYVTSPPPGQSNGKSGTPQTQATSATASTSTSSTIQLYDNPNPHPNIPPGAINSSNWAGYAVVGTPGSITAVQGSYILPKTLCGSADRTDVAYWVGLDGFNSSTVEQAGILSNCNLGQVKYVPWFEFYPAPMTQISGFTARPNDSIFISVTFQQNEITVILKDLTNGDLFNKTTSNIQYSLSSAEWIVEDPSNNRGILSLASFDRSFFGLDYTSDGLTNYVTNAEVVGPLGSNRGSLAITMVQNGTVVASVSNESSDGTSFIVYGSTLVNNSGSSFQWGLLIAGVLVFAGIIVKREADSKSKPFGRHPRKQSKIR